MVLLAACASTWRVQVQALRVWLRRVVTLKVQMQAPMVQAQAQERALLE